MAAHGEVLKAVDTKTIFITSLIAGGLAGTVVDITLFPIDTIKTRLQSEQRFFRAGGFSGLYKGIVPVLIGSAPTASVFFVTYEGIKNATQYKVSESYQSFLHMGAASLAEMVACLVRVPVEVLKQRRQVMLLDRQMLGIKLLYRGYWSTVLRDMPFSLLQFPLWEYYKSLWSSYVERNILPVESAICGAFAGGISAAATTPLDVVKTRIMLANKTVDASELKILRMLQNVYKDRGINGLFAGVVPRVSWITVGGFIFFGTYEYAKVVTTKYLLFLNS